MRQQAEAGEIPLAYLDEVGLAQVHPNRCAWTRVGEQHHLEASRGKRLKVIGSFLATDQVFRVTLWCAVKALLFGGFLGLLREKVGKALTIILDNASFPTARAIKPHLEVLRRRGVTLYFLPPYSPELNRIEKIWHLIKHKWMAVKHRDAITFEADVNAIFDNIGKDFRLAF